MQPNHMNVEALYGMNAAETNEFLGFGEMHLV